MVQENPYVPLVTRDIGDPNRRSEFLSAVQALRIRGLDYRIVDAYAPHAAPEGLPCARTLIVRRFDEESARQIFRIHRYEPLVPQ